MRCVLDSSVALKWVLTEPDMGTARRLRDEASAGLHELLAPDFFPVEVAHTLTRAERQGRIRMVDGWPFWQQVIAAGPVLLPSMPLMLRAYELSSRHRVGVYDCLYVALAERENCEFITADVKLVSALGPTFPFVRPLSAFP